MQLDQAFVGEQEIVKCKIKQLIMKKYFLLTLIIFQLGTMDAQYCPSSASNSNFEWVESFRVSTRTNTSASSEGYEDFTGDAPINLIAGECHNFAINVGYSGTEYAEYYAIWIDLNQDEDFSDPGEQIFNSSAPSVGGVGVNITIPTGAIAGETRMRLIMSYSSISSPCGSFAYGEVEDYTVNMLNADPICTSAGNSTSFEYIESVSINSSEVATGNNGGYTKDLCSPFYLNMGLDNEIILTPGYTSSTEYPEGWTIWIDYDKNDVFESDELVYKNHSSAGPQSFIYRLPVNFKPFEIYRMRITMQYSVYQLNPCANFNYGEVEDYVFVALDPLGVAELTEEIVNTRNKSKVVKMADDVSIALHPNPASEYIQIDIKKEEAIPQVYRVVSGSGKLMEVSSKNQFGDQLRIDVSKYPSGYYIFQVFTEDVWKSVPFIVGH